MKGELEPHYQYVNIHLISLLLIQSWINKPPVFCQGRQETVTRLCRVGEKVQRSVSMLIRKILYFSLRK